mmetsp:Transcript_20433/g.34858  ORF Transcript_20433/g.34858 Transcript_20433/m.34858 type:complete len:209 (+) Transcript_20433:153-779(+)
MATARGGTSANGRSCRALEGGGCGGERGMRVLWAGAPRGRCGRRAQPLVWAPCCAPLEPPRSVGVALSRRCQRWPGSRRPPAPLRPRRGWRARPCRDGWRGATPRRRRQRARPRPPERGRGRRRGGRPSRWRAWSRRGSASPPRRRRPRRWRACARLARGSSRRWRRRTRGRPPGTSRSRSARRALRRGRCSSRCTSSSGSRGGCTRR